MPENKALQPVVVSPEELRLTASHDPPEIPRLNLSLAPDGKGFARLLVEHKMTSMTAISETAADAMKEISRYNAKQAEHRYEKPAMYQHRTELSREVRQLIQYGLAGYIAFSLLRLSIDRLTGWPLAAAIGSIVGILTAGTVLTSYKNREKTKPDSEESEEETEESA